MVVRELRQLFDASSGTPELGGAVTLCFLAIGTALFCIPSRQTRGFAIGLMGTWLGLAVLSGGILTGLN